MKYNNEKSIEFNLIKSICQLATIAAFGYHQLE
jgi:hypothetical protein